MGIITPPQIPIIKLDSDNFLDPKPWPVDETGPIEEEVEEIRRVVKQFTITHPIENKKFLLRCFRRYNKMPRKLKKAAKHITQIKIGNFTIEEQDGGVVAKSPLLHYAIEKGYPHTKWARKNLKLIEWSFINYLKTL